MLMQMGNVLSDTLFSCAEKEEIRFSQTLSALLSGKLIFGAVIQSTVNSP